MNHEPEVRCSYCGTGVPASAAALAAGGNHPECRWPARALLASVGGPTASAHALRVWRARRALDSIVRSIRRNGGRR